MYVYFSLTFANPISHHHLTTSASAPFWSDHHYPTPSFFSYNEMLGQGSTLDTIVRHHLLPLAVEHFPHMHLQTRVQSFEWWCHRRNDVKSGGAHQLHYDLDEKHLAHTGKAQSPLVSMVLYLSGGSGALAPTLVTNQVSLSPLPSAPLPLCMCVSMCLCCATHTTQTPTSPSPPTHNHRCSNQNQ